ncbi:MAG: LptF/LptG family permease [Candidatus Cloacimonadota bacterium]|nr:LptF/LptG family permease [Candidatus Cloacimonadota bacterium]
MKILSRYILKEHVGPFFLAIFVITFVMLLDRILDLLNLIITKHLAFITIGEVFGLSLPFMLALSIPMAVLVATIMAFGRLSSDNEITAFKASGINIYAMMRPVIISAIFLSFFMVYFNNHILPNSNYQLKNLLIKIHSRRPASELKPGIFTKLQHYNFYFHDRDENTGLLNQVLIYDRNDRKIPRTIIAKEGKINFYNGGNSLKAILYDGEIHERSTDNSDSYTAITFKKYKIAIPDLGIKLSRERIAHRGDREMSSQDMQLKIDDLDKSRQSKIVELNKYQSQLKDIESGKNSKSEKEARRLGHLIKLRNQRIKSITSDIYRYKVEIEKKYSIAFACLVFIMLGAPIGMMTRTHSIGIGFAISTLIFMIYYVSLYGGEELADKMIISPFISMWISNIIFSVIGIFLIVYSVRERKIIELGKIINIFKRKKEDREHL